MLIEGTEGWRWESRGGKIPGPTFRLKTRSAEGAVRNGTEGADGESVPAGEEAISEPGWDLQISEDPGGLAGKVRTALRVRHYALRTERTYLAWVRQFEVWCKGCGREAESAEFIDVRAFLDSSPLGMSLEGNVAVGASQPLFQFLSLLELGREGRWWQGAGLSL